MLPSITIRTTTRLARDYQRVLCAGWEDESFLGSAIDLVHRVAESGGDKFVFVAGDEPPPRVTSRPRHPIPPQASESLRRFLENLNSDMVPPVPDRVSRRRGAPEELLALVRKTTFFLSFQFMFAPGGSVGLLLDSQTLLFFATIEHLLPRLARERMKDDHDLLLNTLVYHIGRWQHDPAHQQNLVAAVAGYVGDTTREQEALEASLRLTHPTEHNYITAVQALWHALLVSGKKEEAKLVILRAIREAPSACVSELKTLLDETYADADAA